MSSTMEKDIRGLVVDKEFKDLIAPLSEEEFEMLEESIVSMGKVINPIVVWSGIVLDGHNRYEICQDHGIDAFQVEELDCIDRDEAKLWIIRNQLGRRNMTPYSRGELALQLKPLLERGNKGKNTPQKASPPVRTREDLARIANISQDTLGKVERIHQDASDSDKENLRRGDLSIHSVYKKVKAKDPEENEPKEESHEKEIETLVKGIHSRLQKLCDLRDHMSHSSIEKILSFDVMLKEITQGS